MQLIKQRSKRGVTCHGCGIKSESDPTGRLPWIDVKTKNIRPGQVYLQINNGTTGRGRHEKNYCFPCVNKEMKSKVWGE